MNWTAVMGLFVVIAVVMAVVRARGRVSGAQAKQLVDGGALLLDVRSPGEFGSMHIPGATNIPVQELKGRLGELGAKDRDIVLYCASGMRSGGAAGMLRGAGFTSVHDLGPMAAWPGE